MSLIKVLELFDGYELRARIAPAFIIASPLIFPAVLIMQVVYFQLLESAAIIIVINNLFSIWLSKPDSCKSLTQ